MKKPRVRANDTGGKETQEDPEASQEPRVSAKHVRARDTSGHGYTERSREQVTVSRLSRARET